MSVGVIPVQVALVDQSGEVGFADLQSVAASLNEQILRDFATIWSVKATVAAYQDQPPANTWAVIIQQNLNQPGALGYHTDNGNQPVAYVQYQPPGPQGYSVTVSHETLEMLADPYGNRQHGALLPQNVTPDMVGLTDPAEQVQYLLEVCDPPEGTSYLVGQEYVSDFLLPQWYYSAPQQGILYSHQGGCTQPRQVADGGYCSFATSSGEWWQAFNESGQISVQDLGQFDGSLGHSIREWVDQKAREHRASKA